MAVPTPLTNSRWPEFPETRWSESPEPTRLTEAFRRAVLRLFVRVALRRQCRRYERHRARAPVSRGLARSRLGWWLDRRCAATVGDACLDGWAGNRPVGTEHAAVAGLWPEQRMAARARVEERARVGRHVELLLVTAGGAPEHGLQDRRGHTINLPMFRRASGHHPRHSALTPLSIRQCHWHYQ